MQLKATKLVALLSRLNFALSPTLALLMLVGLAAPLVAQADQWVRFTITKKNTGPAWEDKAFVQLAEFGLYSADGTRQNSGLTYVAESDPSSIGPGHFYLNRGNGSNPNNLFDAGTAKWCFSENVELSDLAAGGVDYLVFTMHLDENAAPVVKYNLCSGGDTSSYPGRAPTCWRVETSDNGIDWVVRDEQNNQATSGYTTANNTWYNGGGSGNAPTTFYRLNRQSPGSGLPAGYTRLDWIKSTRQQHILTDYYPNPKTWMQVDCKLSGAFGSKIGRADDCCSYIYGTVDSDANHYVYVMHFGDDSHQGNEVYCAMDKETNWDTFFNFSMLSVGNDASRNSLTVSNGAEYATVKWTGGMGDVSYKQSAHRKAHDCEDPLVLFGRGDKNFDSYDMTVWSWKIYESEDGSGANNHLVRNFIPALNPDGVPGLYDTVNQQFFGSETDVPFKCSADGTLPSDYTRLDWIKSTRQQRIKTDYVPSDKTWMEAELKLDGGWSYSPTESAALLSSDGTAGYSCHIGSDGGNYNDFMFYYNGNVHFKFNVHTYMLRHTLRLESGVLTWGSETPSCSARTVDCNDALYLFGRKNYNFNMYNMTVYSWKIYESDTGKKGGANETLVHDFVPALDPDGVPGLYDTVSHKFYPSITGTDFVYYRPGSLPADYTRLEYLESTLTGQQYIDVPYVQYATDKPTQITMLGRCTDQSTTSQTFCGFTSAGYSWLGVQANSYKLGNAGSELEFVSSANSLDTITWVADPRNSGTQRQGWLAVDSAQHGQGSATSQSHPNAVEGVPLSIFGTHEGDEVKYFSNYKLYAMTVEQGGVVVADFVPALNSSGVPGLYDLATGQFLTNNGSGEFGHKTAEQWFRLSITQKSGSGTGFMFSEFTLCDVAGNRQNYKLTEASDADNIGPGQFYHNKDGCVAWGDTKSEYAFDGDLSLKLGHSLPWNLDSSGILKVPQVLVMHLTNGAPEVVKYNFCTANAQACKGWSPVAWTLERSYDGQVWDVVDRRTAETSGFPGEVNNTWYKNGGTGSTPEAYFFFGDSGKDTTQWFRLTIQKKANKTGDPRSDKSLQLSEFALYDANGVRQNLNLSQGESAEGLWPGEFYYSSKVPVSFSGLPPHKLFDGKVSAEVDKMYIDYNTSDLSGLCDGDESCWQVLTMRLASGAPEVVKYNMCSGHDTASCTSRAPTAWTLEKSSDGVNWVVCDVQVEATSGYTTANSTWYNNGNSYEMTEFIAVTLDGNGGLPESQVVYVGQGRPLPAIATGNLPTSDGFAFLGYFSASGVRYYNADGTGAKDCDFSENTTLYARWLEGYEPLAKLNFDGSHFILTDYIPKATTWIETEMRTNGTQITGCAALFGMAERFEGDSVDSVYGMNLSAHNSSVYGWVLGVNDSSGGKGRGWLLNDSKLVFSDKCKVRFGYFGFTLSDGSSTFEGAERPQWHKDNRFPCHTKVVIGGYNGFLPLGGEGNLGYGTPVRPYSFTSGGLDVYSFNIYESANGSPADAVQTLKHNFIPVTNTTDKVAGLYDIVGQKFYPLQTQTTVTLNPNGGNQPTNYVYATAGEKMPSPIDVPTRQGYTFAGYSAEGWEARLMTGKETDICNDGTTKFAHMKVTGTLNAVPFDDLLGSGNSGDGVSWSGWSEKLSSSVFGNNGTSGDYAKLLSNACYANKNSPHTGTLTTVTLANLEVGNAYLFQFFVHDGRGGNESDLEVSVDGDTWYQFGQRTESGHQRAEGPTCSKYGVSFIRRFVARATTEIMTVYFRQGSSSSAPYGQFNGMQLRDITEVSGNSLLYYNADGTSDKTYPAANGPTELYAQWELDNYSITYDGLEGADNPDNPVSYTVNDELVLRAPRKRDGYVFGGWRENDVQISYIPTNTTGAKMLTANWVSTNAYQLIEYIATTNCQFLDAGVTPRNAHFGFALDFWDRCHVSSDKEESSWNSARIIGSSKLAPGKGDGCFSGFFFGNWNKGGNGQLVLCSDYGSGYYPVDPRLTGESRLRVKLVNDYDPTGITTNPDHSYSLYTVKRVADDGTETPITPDQYYEHQISGASDPYQDMPDWFAGSVYVGAVNRESQYQTPEGLGYGGTRNNYMRFYRVTFYYDDIVLYDAIPAIDADGHVGLLRVDGAEGEVFAYSKTIDESWLAQTHNSRGAEFATPFFKVNGNGGLPEETTFVRLLDGSTQPALIEDLIPTRDGFMLMGFTNAMGRVYQLDGDNKFVDVPQDGETVYARWFASGDYELLPCLDNGSSLDTAGYVALTNFRLTGANVVELKYCVNAENDDKWQGVFWSRMPEKSYSLVLRNRNHSSGCKWQVTYGVEGDTVSTYDRPIIGTDYVLRLCPTAVGDKGLLGYLDGNPVSWELYNASAMFEDEAQVDTLLFAAGRIDPLVNDEPSRDVAGKMTGPALAKMYYFRVENSATDPTLRLDLVPVRKKATNVRGFYDLVSGNFYPLKTPVVLDGNGGEPSPQYVYTSKGEAMPALPNGAPTRPGYDFKGYYGAIEGGTHYYGADGSVKAASCDFGEGTTLYAQWEPGKYRVINPETGPEIVVDYEWLKSAYGSDKSKAEYQQELFTTNQYGVVNWQSYVLGYGPKELATVAIVEETVQNADPETVTIRLRGLPENPRTNATTRLAYSLYAARTPEAFAKGKDALVEKNGDTTPFEKSEKSTFEAPLSDLTDLEPVNYYRIRVHFIFNKSE